MTRLSPLTPRAVNLASASDRLVKSFASGFTSVAAGTLTLPGTRPGRPYRLGSRPLWNWGPSALTITVPGSLVAASTARLSTKKPWRGEALNVADGQPLARPLSVAPPPALHFSKPPSTTAPPAKTTHR